MAKDTLWFKHDTNSRSDDKIVDLQMEHGMEGIGVYWCIIEMMYEQMGVMRMQCDRIAFELRVDKKVVNDVLQKYGLFQIENDIVTCRRITEEVQARCETSERARVAAVKRWNQATAMRPHSEGNATAMQRREEESREENKREEEITFESEEKKTSKSLSRKKKNLVAPSEVDPSEIHAYFSELGQPHESEKFIDYYSVNGWKVGRNRTPMQDWKAAVRIWARRNISTPSDPNRKLTRNMAVSDVNATRDAMAAFLREKPNNQNQ